MNQKKPFVRILSVLLSALLVAAVFTGCQAPVDINATGAASEAMQDFPVVVNEVTVNAKPSKVAVLSGNMADIIIAMGYEGALVIASEDCTQTELETLPKTQVDNTQAILDIGADLVISDTLTEAQKTAFTTAGIPAVVVEDAHNREDFERMYAQVGSALNGAGTGYNDGTTCAQRIFTTLDDLSRVIPEKETVTTGCYLFDLTSSAVTGDMLGSTLLAYAGITNVLKGAQGGIFEFEKLKVTDPDYIFCPVGLAAQMKANPSFAKLTAVKKNKVIELPATYMSWEGRTVITAATHFASAAYPELLKETSTAPTLPEEIANSKAESASSKAAAKTESESSSKAESSSKVTYEAIEAGTNNDDVLKMQERLAALGFLTVEYSGLFGDATSDALKAFQKANGIKETGNADGDTLAALYADTAKKATT